MSTTTSACGTTRTKKRSDADRIVDLFAFPAFSNLGDVLTGERAGMPAKGRRSPYPDTCLLIVDACARITGSQASTLTLLASDDVLWQRCCAAYLKRHNVRLPTTAPKREHVRYLREKVTDPNRPLLRALASAFTVAAVGQARLMGNLQPGVNPDWANPDPRHAIFGDGTIVKPYSDVTAVLHPLTGAVEYLGSRAKTGAPKIQRVTRAHADKKVHRGINFVSILTRTFAGRIVLAVDSELAAEAWAALDLIDRVIATAGDGVHGVVYDRALTGWHGAYLMGHHRVQLYGKAVARATDDSANGTDDDDSNDRTDDTDWDLDERVQRATAGVQTTKQTRSLVRNDILSALANNRRPLPVGTSVYATEDGFEKVYGVFHFLAANHEVDGLNCEHDLVMDDGALFTVDIDPISELAVKSAHLSCARSVAVQGGARTWQRVSTYRIPCRHGDFDHDMTWTPETTRYTRTSTDTGRSPKDQINSRLHPVARCDIQKFGFISRARNDAESHNSWYKATLPGKNKERGSSITLEGQLLDFLLGAMVQNCDTWVARHN